MWQMKINKWLTVILHAGNKQDIISSLALGDSKQTNK